MNPSTQVKNDFILTGHQLSDCLTDAETLYADFDPKRLATELGDRRETLNNTAAALRLFNRLVDNRYDHITIGAYDFNNLLRLVEGSDLVVRETGGTRFFTGQMIRFLKNGGCLKIMLADYEESWHYAILSKLLTGEEHIPDGYRVTLHSCPLSVNLHRSIFLSLNNQTAIVFHVPYLTGNNLTTYLLEGSSFVSYINEVLDGQSLECSPDCRCPSSDTVLRVFKDDDKTQTFRVRREADTLFDEMVDHCRYDLLNHKRTSGLVRYYRPSLHQILLYEIGEPFRLDPVRHFAPDGLLLNPDEAPDYVSKNSIRGELLARNDYKPTPEDIVLSTANYRSVLSTSQETCFNFINLRFRAFDRYSLQVPSLSVFGRVRHLNRIHSDDIMQAFSLTPQESPVPVPAQEDTAGNLAALLDETEPLPPQITRVRTMRKSPFPRKVSDGQMSGLFDHAQPSTQENKLTLNMEFQLNRKQVEAKYDHLYDGTVNIITGGPGMGKTMVTIERLKLLTTPEAIRDRLQAGQLALSDAQLQELDTHDLKMSWRFFVPSELLKSYIEDAMEGEGIAGVSDRVCVWQDFLCTMLKDYRLLIPSSGGMHGPFSYCATHVIQDAPAILRAFSDYVLAFHRSSLEHYVGSKDARMVLYPKMRVLGDLVDRHTSGGCLSSMNELGRILFEFGQKNRYEEWIDTFQNQLGMNKEVDCLRQIVTGLNVFRSRELVTLCDRLINNAAAFPAPESVYQSDGMERCLHLLVSILPYYIRRVYGLTGTDGCQELGDLLDWLMQRRAEMGITYKEDFHFTRLNAYEVVCRYMRSPEHTLLSSLPTLYLRFRNEKMHLPSLYKTAELRKMLRRNGQIASPISMDESALLLGFVNHVLRDWMETVPGYRQHAGTLAAFRQLSEHAPMVTVVDEVTDFSPMEIYAMESFGHPVLRSLTLTGELVQRLSPGGLLSWDQLAPVLPETCLYPLTENYRLSADMLELASSLYTSVTGSPSGYIMGPVNLKTGRPPLLCVSRSDDLRLKWIKNEIINLHVQAGKSVGTAVFAPDAATCSYVAGYLQNQLHPFAIQVRNCSQGALVGDRSAVRVFPIHMVKGLEFDNVFFHNIQRLRVSGMLKQFLFVGISRVRNFLGISLDKETPDFDFLQPVKHVDYHGKDL